MNDASEPRALDHAVDRDGEIHRGGTRGTNATGVLADFGEELRMVRRRRIDQRGDQANRPGDADGRRAAHGERLDRFAHFVDRAQVALDDAFRQRALIDDAQRALVVGPADGLDDVHGTKATSYRGDCKRCAAARAESAP